MRALRFALGILAAGAAILLLPTPSDVRAQSFRIDLNEVSLYYTELYKQAAHDSLRLRRVGRIDRVRLGQHDWVPNFLPYDFERVRVFQEFDLDGRYRVTFTHPRIYAFNFREERQGVFYYSAPRDLSTPGLQIDIDSIDDVALRRYHRTTQELWREQVVATMNARRREQGPGGGALNFTIPIKLPTFVDRLIGEGEKTHIDISGRESITFAGESRRVSPFIGVEGQQKQSLFPSLDMKQELDVRLNGTIGEKINIQVDHSSSSLSSENNRIRLNYRGFEDDIIQLIELGNTSLSLPGSELVSFSTSSQGLFGIKTLAQVGPADITFIASKQEGETSSATFAPRGGTIGQREERFIRDQQFIANKFFFIDEPFRQGIFPVDAANIEVFRSIQEFERSLPDAPANWLGRAYVDSIGNGTQIGQGDYEERYFKELAQDEDFRFVRSAEDNTTVVGIELIQTINSSEVLAVRYVNDFGDTIGDFREYPQSDTTAMDLELIWPSNPLPQGRFQYTWPYMMRHFYNLGFSDIDKSTFELEIHDDGNRLDTSVPDSSTVSWVRIFGLDRTNDSGTGPPDNRVDLNSAFIDLNSGILQFPILRPFDPPDDSVAVWTDGQFEFKEGQIPGKLPDIYDQEIRAETRSFFTIIVRAASASRTFSIDAFNISEGSEVVRLDGRTLTRGTDYNIDYDTGEVELIGQVAQEITPSSNITIDYEYKPFAGGGSSSLVGFNSIMNFSEKSKFGTTFLYESKTASTLRPRIGEEPTRAIVGDVNGSLRFNPKLFTSLVNVLPLVDTDAQSSLALNAEVAVSVPDPNTLGQVYIDDFEGVEDSDVIPLTRRNWQIASLPIDPADSSGVRTLSSSDRKKVFWYNIEPDRGVHRRDLNPELNEQENSLVPSLDIELESPATSGAEWAGVMTGFAGGLDLLQGQFLEIWVNDFRDSTQRAGKLRIDMGFIDENFYDPDAKGVFNTEDRNRDGFNASTEDSGLDGIFSPNGDPDDDYDPSRDADGRFSGVNGTEGNFLLDTEDLDRSSQMEETNAYFTYEIDLASEPVIDIRKEFPDYDGFREPAHVDDNWRLYRIELGNNRVVGSVARPTLQQIKHLRIWVDSLTQSVGDRIQIAEFKIVGNRWDKDAVRTLDGEIKSRAEDPFSRFALGVISTKSDPVKYIPPFTLASENDIFEKEQSLLISYEEVQDTTAIQIRKRFAGRGFDWTSYRDMRFLVHSDVFTPDAEYYFRVAFDSLNFYEVTLPLESRYFSSGGWAVVTIPLTDLTDLKFEPADSAVFGTAVDLTNPDLTYPVKMVGRPSLFNVRFLYAGLRNNGATPLTGELWLNDIFLGNRKKDIDFAQRFSGSMSMGNVINFNAAWRRTGPDFRGLRQRRGSGSEATGLTLSARTSLQHFIPLLGFRVPVSGNFSRAVTRPKFRPNSDTEITDPADQDSLRTENVTRGFSTSLSRRNSKNRLLRWTFDNLNASFSMSQAMRRSPASADTTTSMSGSADYQINFGPKPRIRLYRKFSLRYWFNSFSFRLNANRRKGTRYRNVGGQLVADPPIYSADINAGGTLSYVPFQGLTTSYRLQTARDLRLGEQEIWGIKIGQETNRSQTVNATFRPPPIWLIRAFSPDLNVNVQYSENAGPNIARPGDPPRTRNAGANRNTSLKLRFDLGKYMGKVFRKLELLDDEEALPQPNRRPPATPERPDTTQAAPDSVQTPEKQKVDPLIAIRKLTSILASIRSIDASVQHRLQSNYVRVHDRPSLAYQLGWALESGVEGFDRPDRAVRTLGITLDSGVQITENLDLAARFGRSRNNTQVANSKTFSRGTTWPDLSLSWKGLERFGPLQRLFTATTATMGYRKTKRESGRLDIVDSTDESMTLNPTATFQWKNGIGSSLSFQMARSTRESRGSASETSTMTIALDMKYAFSPGMTLKLPIPYLRNKKLKSRLDTSLSIGYSRSSGKRSTGSLSLFTPIPGSTQLRVSPRLTYNFSRALNGSFFIDFSRAFNEASNQTTTTVRVGINAVFTF